MIDVINDEAGVDYSREEEDIVAQTERENA